jgi:hypothetical protein
LLNALTTNITHTVEMEATLLGLSTKFIIFNPFKAKILLLHMNILLEVIKVIFFKKTKVFEVFCYGGKLTI